MPGVYGGLRVVDLTQGIAGGLTTMLLADAGAEVIRVDRPDDPFAGLSGYRVWHRGKRRAQLSDDEVLALLGTADVLVETFEEAPEAFDAVDAESWGIGPLHRIYPAAEGWVCLVVRTAGERRRLDAAIPAAAGLEGDALADALGTAFAGDTAEAWGKTLDAHGVPAEVCATAPGTVLFDDPDLKDRGLMTAYTHPVTGAMEMAGRLFDIVGVTASGRPPLLGEHSREILAELGVPDVDGLIEAGVVRG